MVFSSIQSMFRTLPFLFLSFSASFADMTLRVMTFNIWRGGEAGHQPLSQTVKVIRESKADVVGIQESYAGQVDNAVKVAESLGWHHFRQGGRGESTSIISRFPITGHTPRKYGVTIEISKEIIVNLFNVHFKPAPYQPYQLKGIPYGNAPFIRTAKEVREWARKARGSQVDNLLSELKPAIAQGGPVFLTGDLNEPSFQDWTDRARKANLVPVSVKYPATSMVVDAGMVDSYRRIYPDEVKFRGYTWTNRTSPTDPKDFHDRIDYVFACGTTVTGSKVVGENQKNADIVVAPWPSDHRAVVSEFIVSEK